MVGAKGAVRPRGRSRCARSRAAGASSASASGARSVVVLPGLGNCKEEYEGLVAQIRERRGALAPFVGALDVARVDWLRNAAGLRDLKYWQGKLEPRPTVDWYLEKLTAKIEEAESEASGVPITLLAHSAGGWLGRTYLCDVQSPKEANVERFTMLGSPQVPPPEDSGAVDQTRGILNWVNAKSPGAFHPEVAYTTVVGRCSRGARLDCEESDLRAKFTGQVYKQVCGEAAVWGDGIVPIDSAHLEGATQIELEGIYHSPVGKREQPWYGDAEAVEQYIDHL